MESVRERLNIEDYSVSQTTLDQVFITFARAQITTAQTKERGFRKRGRELLAKICFWEFCTSKFKTLRREYRKNLKIFLVNSFITI